MSSRSCLKHCHSQENDSFPSNQIQIVEAKGERNSLIFTVLVENISSMSPVSCGVPTEDQIRQHSLEFPTLPQEEDTDFYLFKRKISSCFSGISILHSYYLSVFSRQKDRPPLPWSGKWLIQ